MKNIIILAAAFLSLSSQASLFGKYKLELSNGLSGDSGEYVFLMNSNLEVTELSDEGDYYVSDFNVSRFFGEVEFRVSWGSDEDKHYFVMNLTSLNGKPVLTESCGVYVDGPGGYSDFDEAYSVLKKWNVSTKRYDVVKADETVSAMKLCNEKLEEMI